MEIYGTVTDLTGAFPDGGIVRVVCHTGYTASSTIDNTTYNVVVLDPGIYEVTIYHSGYVDTIRDGIVVNFGDWVQCDFTDSSGYAPRGCIEGYIRDEDSNGIPDAMIWGIHDYNTKSYGCNTNSSGYYVLALHDIGVYHINYGKNNYNIEENCMDYELPLSQHPTSTSIRNYTLNRRASDILPVNNRSVIIFDDMCSYGLEMLDLFAKPYNVGTTKVYGKTRKITTDIGYRTSTGWGDGEGRCGSGGTDYNGTAGQYPGNPPPSWADSGVCVSPACSSGETPCSSTGYSDRYNEGGYYIQGMSAYSYPARVKYKTYDASGTIYTDYLQVGDYFLFNNIYRCVTTITPNLLYSCVSGEDVLWWWSEFKWLV